MSNQSSNKREPKVVETERPSVDALASRALTLVAERNLKDNVQIDADLAKRLRDAAAGEERDAVPALVAEMLASGVLPEAIAMLYIPHAARQMGEDWCDDTLSFARVTIGTARLQSSLRSLGTEWASHGYGEELNGEGGVIVIVAKDAYHTLGALILCGQLRRLGLSVRLAMGASSEDLKALFLTTSFDAALISATEVETIESVRNCVDLIRKSSSVCPAIIVGGSILDQDADVKTLTGADFATTDPFEALEHCGLTMKLPSETPSPKRRS